MTRALFVQHGEGGFRDVDDAEQVRLDLGAKVILGGVLDGRGVGIPGIVDHHVERAEDVERRADDGPSCRGISDVKCGRSDPVTVLLYQVVQSSGPTSSCNDTVAAIEGCLGDLLARTPGSSR